MKPFLIKTCPNCFHDLIIEPGKTEDILKLKCPNIHCSGSDIKKLQKGIEILEIKSLGPKTIEKLYNAGIKKSSELFDSSLMNKENLINSGEFKEGKQLDNIFEELSKIKEIKIDKAIYSLQILLDKDNGENGYISIGKSLSEQIGRMLSNAKYNFEGLSIQVRDDISKGEDSEILNNIKNELSLFEDNNIKILPFEEKVIENVKKVFKKVFIIDEGIEKINFNKTDLINKLQWSETNNIDDCDFAIIENKNDENYKLAKEKNIKILNFNQIKLLYL